MNIPIEGLLQQMQSELQAAERKARLDDSYRVREHVRALKSLCELVLQQEKVEQNPSKTHTGSASQDKDFQQHLHMMEYGSGKPAMPIDNRVTKPLEGKKIDEDDANGDSLFDF